MGPARRCAAGRPRCGVAAPGAARPAHLIGGEQTAVGQTGAPVLEVHEAAHLGLQPAADLLQEVAQRRVVRQLRDALPRKLRVAQIAQVFLEGTHRGSFCRRPAVRGLNLAPGHDSTKGGQEGTAAAA